MPETQQEVGLNDTMSPEIHTPTPAEYFRTLFETIYKFDERDYEHRRMMTLQYITDEFPNIIEKGTLCGQLEAHLKILAGLTGDEALLSPDNRKTTGLIANILLEFKTPKR